MINVIFSKLEKKNIEKAESLIKDLLKDRKLDKTEIVETHTISQNPLSAYTLQFNSNLPPPPPIYAQGKMELTPLTQEIKYPSTDHPAMNMMNNYPQVYNPYYGNLWQYHPLHRSAYEYMPFGLHPFMFPSMGSYGLNPLGAMNPMFGSLNPFMNVQSAMMALTQQNGHNPQNPSQNDNEQNPQTNLAPEQQEELI
jgi:hypothetical protein